MRNRLVNLSQIEGLAKELAQTLRGGEIFALVGPLGAGKTTFVQAVGKNLKLKAKITSPTFTLMRALPTRLKNKQHRVTLYHLDLYRLKTFKDVKALGLTEIWGQPNAITFIEWADKISRHLPKKTKIIKFLGQ